MTSELIARFEKRFPGGAALDVDFAQSTYGFSVTALIGPSGCGKTTFLRCLAGLSQPNSGTITFRGQAWFDGRRHLTRTPQQRDVGFLFQDYALFPHLNVAENIGYGLRRWTRTDRQNRVDELIDRLGLRGLEQRFPRQISGGQQQRVALARILARRPQFLLLDEPLSALDAILREKLRSDLRQILLEFEIPVIFVTHDRVEAIALADRVAVMDDGRIQQIGSVEDVFTRPKNAALAQLVGVETVVAGEIIKLDQGLATVRVGSVLLTAVAPIRDVQLVHVCIKGEDVALQKGSLGPTTVRNQLTATITSLSPEGPLVRVTLNCGFQMTALITRPSREELQLNVGDPVTAMVKAPAIHLIERVT